MSELVGTTLEHYRIVEKIGEGGMGTVFRARDERLGREVAIKMLPQQLADDAAKRERFEREARATAALDHPNILAIHELGLHDGVPFIVTELLEGHSLRTEIVDGPLDPWRAVEYAMQVVKGLAAAHDKGIIHRDLKPENLFVTSNGVLRILDFGLAKLVEVHPQGDDGSEAATATLAGTEIGTVLGTSGYMSPEQLRGLPVDCRTDIFSFGVVLYEMLTGSNPFRRHTHADSVSAVLTEHPPTVSQCDERVPKWFDGIVERCLAKHPHDRFQSARDLGDALQRALARPSGEPAGRSGRIAKIAQLAAAGALAAGFAASGAWYLSHRAGGGAEDGETPAASLPRVVVLQFDNLGRGEDDYFAAGIGDEITSRLAAVSGLETVTPPREPGSDRNLADLARALEVDYVLSGTVRWSGSAEGPQQVRVTPKLIRAEDGNLLWSQVFDRTLDDIFVVQADIAERVLAELDVTLLGTERDAVVAIPTSSMEAYQVYLRGVYYAQSLVEEDALLTVSMLERAVAIDPAFAVAWAELSIAHSRLVAERIDDSEARIASAAAAVDRALSLEPGLARGQLARAVYLAVGLRDRSAALAELQVARRSAPGDSRVVEWQARILLGEGHIQDSVGVLEQLTEMDPTSYQAHCSLGRLLTFSRRHSEADAAYQRAVALQPDRLDAYLGRLWNALAWEGGTDLARMVLASMPVPTHRDAREIEVFMLFAERDFAQALELLAQMPARGVESAIWWWPTELLECHAYVWLGRESEGSRSCMAALADAQAALKLRPRDPRLWTTVGYSQALLGRREDAVRAAERACSLASPDAIEQDQFRRDLAAILAMVGDADRAVDELRAALARPSWLTQAWLAIDWRYDPVRDDPGFQKLATE